MSLAISYSEDIFSGLYEVGDWPTRLGEKVERVEALRAAQSNVYSPFLTTLLEIESVWMDRRQVGWDGYNARPIKKASAEDAQEFLKQLPPELVQPDVVPESEGTLAFEWQKGDSVFVVSFQAAGKLVYAGDFDNGRRLRGHENLAKGVPQTIATVLGTEFVSE